MMFNSLIFGFYLPIVFLLYWFVFKKLNWQNAFVVFASYVFYGWWDWKFLILIFITTICSYISGLLIEKSRSSKTRKWVLGFNITLNLGILGLFKYFNFFTSNLQYLLNPLGIVLDDITIKLILPVGISFYTFQALSYTIDVYRNKITATKSIYAFFAFISFFPQLVAGPIERATNLLPQFLAPRKFDYALAVDGCRQILWGFFKKLLVADNCAIIVNSIFEDYTSFGAFNLWVGAILFAFQIYGDFSGYSDIAIGVAKLFGIKLMKNFNVPYFSRDIAEFWRRWHISLNTWFVDYVYIPLGGSRHGKLKKFRNTFSVFLLSGLWHGANWTFVSWGLWNALLFMPLVLLDKHKANTDTIGKTVFFPTIKESAMMGITFLLVCIGWVLFRGDTLSDAILYIKGMFSEPLFCNFPANFGFYRTFIPILILLLVEWTMRKHNHPFDIYGNGLLRYKYIRWGLYLLIVMMTFLFHTPTTNSEFIYFQF